MLTVMPDDASMSVELASIDEAPAPAAGSTLSRRSLFVGAGIFGTLIALGVDSLPASAVENWVHPFIQQIGVERAWGGCYSDYTWDQQSGCQKPQGPHRGIDYAHAGGTIVHSVAGGRVVFAGNRGGDPSWSWAGNYVELRHASGWTSLYAHMSSLSVSTGDSIAGGVPVGRVGRTGGNWGNHLHLEIWRSASRSSHTDPFPLIHDAPPPGGSPQPPQEGFLMALSDFQQKQVYDALVAQSPGGAYYKPDALINIIRSEIAPAIAAIAAGNIKFPNAQYNAFDAIINEVRGANGAAAPAGHVTAGSDRSVIQDTLSSLTDSELSQLAAAISLENSRRATA